MVHWYMLQNMEKQVGWIEDEITETTDKNQQKKKEKEKKNKFFFLQN